MERFAIDSAINLLNQNPLYQAANTEVERGDILYDAQTQKTKYRETLTYPLRQATNPLKGQIFIQNGALGVVYDQDKVNGKRSILPHNFVVTYDLQNAAKKTIEDPKEIQWAMKMKGFNNIGLTNFTGLKFVDGEFQFVTL